MDDTISIVLFSGTDDKLAVAAVVFPAAWWVVGRRPSER